MIEYFLYFALQSDFLSLANGGDLLARKLQFFPLWNIFLNTFKHVSFIEETE